MVHRKFDWRPRFDPRSRNYGISTLLGSVADEPRTWTPGVVLDQGSEGACVGFGWTGELLASPRPYPVSPLVANAYALGVYRAAKQIDEWEGDAYSGTSVLAGAKVIANTGAITEYRWAFSIDEVRDAVVAEGPVVIGIPWLSGMYDTRPSGLVDVSGQIVGGHCILITGYHPHMRIKGEGWLARHRVFRWRNSWGPGYGINGSGLIRYDDLAGLLAQQGEACVPVGRKQVRL